MTDPQKLLQLRAVIAEQLAPADRAKLADVQTEKDIWDIALDAFVRVNGVSVRKFDRKIVEDKELNEKFAALVNIIPDLPPRYKDRPLKYALGEAQMRIAETMTYQPGGPDWLPGEQFNMWKDPQIEPLAERPEIFIEHITRLIPDQQERRLVFDFLKWLVQHPTEKMSFALLIVGRFGVGKSWLGLLLNCLFGPTNVLLIPKGSRATEKFNLEKANKRIVFIDELLPDGKMNFADQIASEIVGGNIWIEPKGVNKFSVPNCFDIVGISNYENALKLKGRTDRKWLVARASDDLPHADADGNETQATRDYFTRLFATTPKDGTITEEVRRVYHLLSTRKFVTDFNGKGIAPMTSAKDDVADATESTIESTIGGAYVDKEGPFRFELFTLADVRRYVAQDVAIAPNDKAVDAEISQAMVTAGARRVGSKQVYVGGSKRPVRMWCSHKDLLPKYEKMTAAELAAAYRAERAA